MSQADDVRLLKDCLNGSPGAWEALLARHGPAMRRAAAACLGNAAEAEEVCQKVFVKLVTEEGRALASFRGACSLRTWLALVVLGEAVDHLRSERREHRKAAQRDASLPEVPTPLQALFRAEEAERLHAALERLLPQDRLLLRLLYWDGATHAEAARILGVSGKSITWLLQRSQERLRQCLREFRPGG